MSSVHSECPICIEAYTEKVRQKVTCKNCSYECCTTCVKTYLLSTSDDPHCMNCRRVWDRDYLYDILTKSFVNTKLRKHRRDLLLEREKARIPNTQTYVDYLIQRQDKEEKMKEIKSRISDLWLEYNTLSREVRNMDHNHAKEEPQPKRRMLKCPFSNCRGYLSGNTCNICKHTTCRDCMTIIDMDSNGDEAQEHVCDEDAKKSTELILKETKPCPSCSERIFKISGCDQMWCTQCNVAFSWTTGKLMTGTVHNPHYYQWLANGGNGNARPVRNAGDVVCGGLVNIVRLHGHDNNITQQLGRKSDIYNRIMNLHRSINHTQETIIHESRQKLNHKINDKLRNARADFMMNKLTEDKWSKRIGTLDLEREKEQALLHIYETYCTIAIERFNHFAEAGRVRADYHGEFIKLEKEMKPIMIYLNEQLKRISSNYNVSYYGFHLSGVLKLFKLKEF